MAVLVLGGYGLIGSAVVARLCDRPVVGLGRDVAVSRRRWPGVDWREADLAQLLRAEDWTPLLAGVESVVNAAGVLQQGLRDDVAGVQERAMLALYAAARQTGIKRIVQISAVGAEPRASTEFLRSKARADDALSASGLDYVILRPGLVISSAAYGGTALIRAAKVLDSLKLEGDQKVGVNLIKRAIEEPLRWIATNAGLEGSIVVQKVRELDAESGFNALTDTYENLVNAGVIDPTKVVRTALQNSASIASLLLTTEALVSEIPEDKKEAAMPPGGGGMGGMY